MTIAKGRSWGTRAAPPDDLVVVHSDAQAADAVAEALAAHAAPPPLGLLGGDLARTLGSPGDDRRLTSGDAIRLPLDVGIASLDGERHPFVAHAVLRRSWWRGTVVTAMNAEWIGPWDVAPRAHPNDGLLDVLETDMRLGERLKARSRLRTGAHIPHPAIKVRRLADVSFEFARPLDVYLDGRRVGRCTRLRLEVLPDALVGYV